MKHLALWFVAVTFVVGFASPVFAQAPMTTPTPTMPEKSEMKGEMKTGTTSEKPMAEKQSEKTSMQKPDTMMEKQSDGMAQKAKGMAMEKK